MRLLQLNVWGGRLEPQVGDLLDAERPDIVCLQEAISFGSQGTGLFITIEDIQSRFKLPYLSFGPVFSFAYMKGTARFGNCILSKYPIKKTEIVFTYLEHKEDFMWGEDSSNIRNFVHGVVDIHGKPLNILTHHGYWVREHKNGTPETLEQTAQIAEYVRQLEGPVVLTGDFNLTPHSQSIEQINAVLENLTLTHELKTTRTGLTSKTEACDFIFVNGQINVKRFAALDKVASDHKALVLDFGLRT